VRIKRLLSLLTVLLFLSSNVFATPRGNLYSDTIAVYLDHKALEGKGEDFIKEESFLTIEIKSTNFTELHQEISEIMRSGQACKGSVDVTGWPGLILRSGNTTPKMQLRRDGKPTQYMAIGVTNTKVEIHNHSLGDAQWIEFVGYQGEEPNYKETDRSRWIWADGAFEYQKITASRMEDIARYPDLFAYLKAIMTAGVDREDEEVDVTDWPATHVESGQTSTIMKLRNDGKPTKTLYFRDKKNINNIGVRVHCVGDEKWIEYVGYRKKDDISEAISRSRWVWAGDGFDFVPIIKASMADIDTYADLIVYLEAIMTAGDDREDESVDVTNWVGTDIVRGATSEYMKMRKDGKDNRAMHFGDNEDIDKVEVRAHCTKEKKWIEYSGYQKTDEGYAIIGRSRWKWTGDGFDYTVITPLNIEQINNYSDLLAYLTTVMTSQTPLEASRDVTDWRGTDSDAGHISKIIPLYKEGKPVVYLGLGTKLTKFEIDIHSLDDEQWIEIVAYRGEEPDYQETGRNRWVWNGKQFLYDEMTRSVMEDVQNFSELFAYLKKIMTSDEDFNDEEVDITDFKGTNCELGNTSWLMNLRVKGKPTNYIQFHLKGKEIPKFVIISHCVGVERWIDYVGYETHDERCQEIARTRWLWSNDGFDHPTIVQETMASIDNYVDLSKYLEKVMRSGEDKEDESVDVTDWANTNLEAGTTSSAMHLKAYGKSVFSIRLGNYADIDNVEVHAHCVQDEQWIEYVGYKKVGDDYQVVGRSRWVWTGDGFDFTAIHEKNVHAIHSYPLLMDYLKVIMEENNPIDVAIDVTDWKSTNKRTGYTSSAMNLMRDGKSVLYMGIGTYHDKVEFHIHTSENEKWIEYVGYTEEVVGDEVHYKEKARSRWFWNGNGFTFHSTTLSSKRTGPRVSRESKEQTMDGAINEALKDMFDKFATYFSARHSLHVRNIL